jgi:hypothetical protein
MENYTMRDTDQSEDGQIEKWSIYRINVWTLDRFHKQGIVLTNKPARPLRP